MRKSILVLAIVLSACQDALVDPQSHVLRPQFDDAPAGVTSFDVGAKYNCAVDTGVVVCHGSPESFDDYGQSPASHTAASGYFTQVSAYDAIVCAVTNLGAVQCWGKNDNGGAPGLLTATGATYTQVGVSSDHGCALRSDGAIDCWGGNNFGESANKPVPAPHTFTQVAVGLYANCGLRSDGAVACWGRNDDNEGPALKQAATGTFTSVAAGAVHFCALRSDGAVECWGSNGSQQAPAVRQAAGGLTYTAVDLTNNKSCALRSDHKVECWSFFPEYYKSWFGTPAQFAIGKHGGCMLLTGGGVECWGDPAAYEPALRPDQPTNVDAVGVNAMRVDVSWTAPAAGLPVTTYQVQRDFGGGFGSLNSLNYYSVPGTQTSLSDSLSGFYQYRARACNGMNCSDWVYSPASGYTSSLPPAPPTGQAVAQSGSNLVFTWADPNAVNVSVYAMEVEWGKFDDDLGAFGPWVTAGSLPASARSYSLPFTQRGLYRFHVRARNGNGPSEWAEAEVLAEVLPNAPTAIQALFPGNVRLTWVDGSDNEATFEVQRRYETAPGVWSLWLAAGTLGIDETQWNPAYQPAVLNQYRVRACNAIGCSAYIGSRKFLTIALPDVPTSMTSSGTEYAVSNTWTDPFSEADHYEVYRRTYSAGVWSSFTLIASPTSLTYTDNTIVRATRYQYRVHGCNEAGCSKYATAAPVFTQTIPFAPLSPVLSRTNASTVRFSWNDVSGNEQRFEIQRRVATTAGVSAWSAFTLAGEDATHVDDASAVTGSTYIYRVRACNEAGCSAYTASIRVR